MLVTSHIIDATAGLAPYATASSPSKPTPPASRYGRALDTAGQLAAYADRARIAGLTCERAYDEVRRVGSAGD